MASAKSTIKQHNAKAKQNNSFLNTKFDVTSVRTIPDIGGFYYNEFRQRVEELQQQNNSLLTSASQVFQNIIFKNRKTDFSQVSARKSGQEIAVFQPTKKNLAIVEELTREPGKHALRVLLASNVMTSGRAFEPEQIKQMMMQLAMPLGLGSFDVGNLKLLVSANRMYKNKLLSKFRTTREKMSKGVEVGNANKNPQFTAVHNNERLLTKLLKLPIDKLPTTDFIQSIQMSTIQKALDGTLPAQRGKTIKDTRLQIERNLTGIVMSLMEVEFLHPELFRFIDETMKKLNPLSPLPFYLEACIWGNELKNMTVQEEFAVKGVDLMHLNSELLPSELNSEYLNSSMKNALKKCLVAYGNSIKLLSGIGNMRQMQQKILLDHAQICLYAFSLKEQLKIPPSVFKEFLLGGRKSLLMSKLTEEYDKRGLLGNYQQILEAQGLPPLKSS
ncbi:MAG: hypothetical protein HQM11_14475 [SAR324 cluster bacterium]|nr:hypothetical protein [SAR324 cluster bacterium]